MILLKLDFIFISKLNYYFFNRECLRGHINSSDDPIIKCPYNKDYSCLYTLQDREIRGLLMKKNGDDYKKYQMKCLSKSEATMQNVFHCKTPDCIGFCIFEDNLNFFDCTNKDNFKLLE